MLLDSARGVQLDGAESLLKAALDRRISVARTTQAGVYRHLAVSAAEHPPHRQACALRHKVIQRDVDAGDHCRDRAGFAGLQAQHVAQGCHRCPCLCWRRECPPHQQRCKHFFQHSRAVVDAEARKVAPDFSPPSTPSSSCTATSRLTTLAIGIIGVSTVRGSGASRANASTERMRTGNAVFNNVASGVFMHHHLLRGSAYDSIMKFLRCDMIFI